MIRPFITLSGTFPIDRTSATTMTASYQAIKNAVLEQVKTCISAANIGFTFSSQTVPVGDTQTLYQYFDTPWGCQLRITLTVTVGANNQGNPITVTFGAAAFKNNVTMALFGMHTIGVSVNYPTEFLIDFDSAMLCSPNFWRAVMYRANFAWLPPFLVSDYVIVRYRDLRNNTLLWGGIQQSAAGTPLQNITTAINTVGFPAQFTSGHIRSDGQLLRLLALDEIYFSEANNATSALNAKLEKDDELLYAVGGAAAILTTGNKIKVGEKLYFAALQLNGKTILAEIGG